MAQTGREKNNNLISIGRQQTCKKAPRIKSAQHGQKIKVQRKKSTVHLHAKIEQLEIKIYPQKSAPFTLVPKEKNTHEILSYKSNKTYAVSMLKTIKH